MLSSDQKLSVSSFNIYSETRKSTRPKRVENDASARPPNLPSDPQRWSFHTLASWTIVPIFASKSVHFFSKYRAHKFGNRQTDERTDRPRTQCLRVLGWPGSCSTAYRSNRPVHWAGLMLDRSGVGQLSSLSSRTKWQPSVSPADNSCHFVLLDG